MALSDIERWILARYGYVAFGIAVSVAVYSLWPFKDLALGDLDWMWFSGFALYLVLLPVSLSLPGRVDNVLSRLADRALLAPRARLGAFTRSLHHAARQWALVMSIVTVGLLAVSWLIAYHGHQLVSMIIEMVAAVPMGRLLGRAMTYGRLAHRLRQYGMRVATEIDHPDEVSGLGPITALFFFQAMAIASIAAYLAIWLLLIPVLSPRYDRWRLPYIWLQIFVICCELLVFLAPLWSFHRVMQQDKLRLLREADLIGTEIVRIANKIVKIVQISEERGEDELQRLRRRQEELARRYRKIETMPTWPIPPTLRRRLSIGNLILLLPALAHVLPAQVQPFLKVIGG